MADFSNQSLGSDGAFQGNGDVGDNNQQSDSAPKKRDRWSKAPDPESTGSEEQRPIEKEPEEANQKKKSRWGAKQPEPVPASAALAMVPFGAPVLAAPGVSIVPFGTTAALAGVNPVNPEQLKVQLRIAEIQNLYNKPRSVQIWIAGFFPFIFIFPFCSLSSMNSAWKTTLLASTGIQRKSLGNLVQDSVLRLPNLLMTVWGGVQTLGI